MDFQLDDDELSVIKKCAELYASSYDPLDETFKQLIMKAYSKGYEQGKLDERQENYWGSMGEDL